MNITLNRLVISQRARVGGMKWVFKQNAPTAEPYVGGVLSGDMKKGDAIFAGDFGYYDYENRLIYHLNQFELAQDLAAEDTEVYFYDTGFSHRLRSDMFIMAEPEASDSTGKAVACSSLERTSMTIDSKDMNVYKVTIEAGALGTASKGDIFVEAAEAGDAVAPKITKVNCIFKSSEELPVDLTDEDLDNTHGIKTVTPYYHCTVMANRVFVPKIAPENKCPIDEYYEL